MNINKLDWWWTWKLDDRHLMILCLNPQIHQAIWCLEMDWRCFVSSKVAENRKCVEVIRRLKVWIYIGSKNRSKISETALASSPASNTPMRTLVRTLYSWFEAYLISSEVGKKALFWDKDAGRRDQCRIRQWGRWIPLKTHENAAKLCGVLDQRRIHWWGRWRGCFLFP